MTRVDALKKRLVPGWPTILKCLRIVMFGSSISLAGSLIVEPGAARSRIYASLSPTAVAPSLERSKVRFREYFLCAAPLFS